MSGGGARCDLRRSVHGRDRRLSTTGASVLPTTSDGGALHLFDIASGSATAAGQANRQVVPAPDDGVDATPMDGSPGLSARRAHSRSLAIDRPQQPRSSLPRRSTHSTRIESKGPALMSYPPFARPLSPRLFAATAAVLLPAGMLVAAPAANAASTTAPPGNFSSSLESPDPQPAASTVEVDASGRPVQANLSGSSPTGLPGSLLGSVIGVTASAENPPDEVAANLADANPDQVAGLRLRPAGCATSSAKPATVVRYSLTSANDAPARDPKDFTLQGSNDGTTWTDLDSRTGHELQRAVRHQHLRFANTTAVRLLPAERHRELR